ncbi:MAG: Prokaryotic Cytochrome oxidase subunit [Panacagrimonas sp.]|jgi:heme/copper-type cytochrome/quinol oxidase subunit 4|nr:cytochrome C oxidase subunit IV family protein [Panacagrimonas sp.]MCC2657898.1 Prokaryotic Cytochrome oxidase subunit [Panacagrimonas sp.]
MNELFRQTASKVWLLLMAATFVTTWMLTKDAFPLRIATIAIVLIAAIKVRLVLLHFMELRHAPLPLRLVFEAWVIAVTGALIALYWLTPAAG